MHVYAKKKNLAIFYCTFDAFPLNIELKIFNVEVKL